MSKSDLRQWDACCPWDGCGDADQAPSFGILSPRPENSHHQARKPPFVFVSLDRRGKEGRKALHSSAANDLMLIVGVRARLLGHSSVDITVSACIPSTNLECKVTNDDRHLGETTCCLRLERSRGTACLNVISLLRH